MSLPGGLRAFMAFTEDVINWRIVNLVDWQGDRQSIYRDHRTFRFDRGRYEAQITGLPSAPVQDWTAELPINKQWWAAVLGD